jgi:GT2 family glycosyltransferase
LVFGRRRERAPDASIYNALVDDEWNVPIGEVGACGGDILIRREAYEAVGGYPETMIAGEEPDMSMRLTAAGWTLRRIDAEMTLHDAAIANFGQWWTRARRAGHAFAELADRHPEVRSPDWRGVCKRILIWGGVLPGIAILGLLLAIFVDIRWLLLPLLLVLGWCLNVLRLMIRRLGDGLPAPIAQASAFFLMLGKFPEFLGLATYRLNRRRGAQASLIEYKK